MEISIEQLINRYLEKINKIQKELLRGQYLYEGKFTQEKLAELAMILYEDWSKIVELSEYPNDEYPDIEELGKEFECTVYNVHISWMKKGKLGRSYKRDMGPPDNPKNLLWVTVVLMYYDAIDTPAELSTWLLAFKNRYGDYCLTDKGVMWVRKHARIITNRLRPDRTWPDHLVYVRQASIKTSRTDNSTTAEKDTSPLSIPSQNLSDPREETVNTDALYHVSQIEEACDYFDCNTEHLPKLTRKRMGKLFQKMSAILIGSE